MSRIAEQLQRIRKPAAPMGFGLAAETPRRRMMFVVHVDGQLDADDLATALGCADAVVVVQGEGGCEPVLQTGTVRQPGMPVGAWVTGTMAAPSESAGYDFLLCDLSSSSEVLVQTGRGLLVQVDSDVESSRLRAIGELGVDALVLDAGELDLVTLSLLVECRRIRAAGGKPLLLRLRGPVTPGVLSALWQAGVDGLLAGSRLGAATLKSIRSVVDSATYESRSASRGLAVSIGAQIGAAGQSQPDEEEGEGDEEEEGDEDE